MSVKIRLKKTGRHKDPNYRVVVVDSRKKRDGRVLETLGHYHPQDDFPNAVIDLKKVEEWKRKGAQITDTVKSIVMKLRKSSIKEAL
ncbi:MAG: 30S ribosomal protein S16 [Elusimicrobiota bacterium]